MEYKLQEQGYTAYTMHERKHILENFHILIEGNENTSADMSA